MIGGMSGVIAGALGEGAADVLAILINGDDRVAEYSASSSVGIRRAPYATYPNTYKAVTGLECMRRGAVRRDHVAAGHADGRHRGGPRGVADLIGGCDELHSGDARLQDMRSGLLGGARGLDCRSGMRSPPMGSARVPAR